MGVITVFLGSVRRERQGHKVAEWVADRLKQRGHTVHLIDPLRHPDLLSLTDRFKTKPEPAQDFKQVQSWVAGSDGYVAVTPEYNHGYSGALKSALDCFLEEYFFKPFAIVSYSGGRMGGIRAAEQLRCVCAELGAPAIPTSLAVGRVQELFDGQGRLQDPDYDRRLGEMLDEFDWYVDAMAAQRQKGTPY
jgi:NAD(P)H-dependent FMN reductase